MENKSSVKLYWWAKNNNFGDYLSPLMFNHYTKVAPIWAEPAAAQVLLTGSNLDVIPHLGWRGVVAGAGMLHSYTRVDVSKARVLGVRGLLTAENLTGLPEEYTLGDPGLLASELVFPERSTIGIGVVPHWTDTELWPRELANSRKYGYGPVTLINPTEPPLEVIRKIGSCDKIITSSLHAVIVADSFSLPRRVEKFDKMDTSPHEGDEFKFQDYASALGTEITFGKMEWAPKEMVDTRKAELYNMMKELSRLVHA